ncbi:MAG: class I SAM-dependent methyltransferase, partial [Chloroflexota bacterium]
LSLSTLTPNFFSENSPFLNHPLLTAERTAGEVDFILAQTQLAAGSRILDVGCGFGRHTLELAKRGYTAVGIDPSSAMIAAAEERKSELKPSAQANTNFVVSDGESFSDEEKFDAVICLMTTLGQVGPNGENAGLLSAIAQNLRDSGRLILEVPQRDAAAQALKPRDKFGSETQHTTIERSFDAQSTRVTEQFEIVSPGNTNRFLLSYRLFSRLEVETLLHRAGFKVQGSFSNFSGEPLSEDSLNMIFLAAKVG